MMNVLLPPGRSGHMALATLLTLGLVAGAMGAGNQADKAAQPALSVAVTTAAPAEWPIRLTAGGNVMAWQEASVGAEVGGLRLTDVKVNVGDTVKRGQVLATFSTITVEADVAQARAVLAETQATLAEAAANAERARQLSDSGAMSGQQVNQLITAERTAQARMESARAALENQQTRLRQTRLLAPDAGVISARSATVGAVVGAGQELFRLIRDHRLEWRAEVPATELARIKAGQAVRITPVGGAAVAGRVRMVAPTVDPQTRNGLVYVDLPRTGDARAGMFARGEFDLGSAQAMTLPQSAVLLRDGFAFAFVLGDDAKVAMTKVGIGRRVGERIEIISGLPPGARVVAAGGGFLSDGDLVRVVDTPSAAEQTARP
jgi:HlyD family secretion protein